MANPQNEEIGKRVAQLFVNASANPTVNSRNMLTDADLWTKVAAALKGEGGEEEGRGPPEDKPGKGNQGEPKDADAEGVSAVDKASEGKSGKKGK
jgi:hypothetical protein